jgi:hypothetical protein
MAMALKADRRGIKADAPPAADATKKGPRTVWPSKAPRSRGSFSKMAKENGAPLKS